MAMGNRYANAILAAALPPKADIDRARQTCPLCAKSELMQRSKSYNPRPAEAGRDRLD